MVWVGHQDELVWGQLDAGQAGGGVAFDQRAIPRARADPAVELVDGRHRPVALERRATGGERGGGARNMLGFGHLDKGSNLLQSERRLAHGDILAWLMKNITNC